MCLSMAKEILDVVWQMYLEARDIAQIYKIKL